MNRFKFYWEDEEEAREYIEKVMIKRFSPHYVQTPKNKVSGFFCNQGIYFRQESMLTSRKDSWDYQGIFISINLNFRISLGLFQQETNANWEYGHR